MTAQTISQSVTTADANATTDPTSPSTSTLRESPALLIPGARGEEVEALQRQLQGLGYYEGPIDGLYGEGTEAGVKRFQQEAGLPQTGGLDALTWQRLRSPQAPVEKSAAGAAGLLNLDEPTGDVADAAGDASTAPDPAVSPPPSEASQPSGRRFWMALGGLGLVLSAVSVGVAIALWQRLQQTTAELHARDRSLDASEANGANPTHQIGTTVDSNPSAPIEPLSSPSRLARANIVDELVVDLQSSDPSTRHTAIWELGQRGHSTAVQPLVDIFLDADSKERSLILAALSEVGIQTLKPMNRALVLSLQDPNPEVRKNAIRDLTRLYDLVGQVSQMLGHAAQDTSPDVQDTARWAIDQLGRIRLTAGSASATEPPPELQSPDASSPSGQSDSGYR